MGKEKFLKKLEELLARVPEGDRKEMLNDYEKYFSARMEKGTTEAAIVNELGDPHVIARDLLIEYRQAQLGKDTKVPTEQVTMESKPIQIEKKPSSSSVGTSLLKAIGMGFFNLVFILGPLLGIIGAYIGLWAASIVLVLSPLGTIGAMFFSSVDEIMMIFFLSLITCSLGIFLSIGLLYLGRILFAAIHRYGRFNLRVIKGKKGEIMA